MDSISEIVCYYPNIRNRELWKDVYCIPAWFSKTRDSLIVGFDVERNEKCIRESELFSRFENLGLHLIGRDRWRISQLVRIAAYMWNGVSGCRLLVLTQDKFENYVVALIARLRKSDIRIVVKLDTNQNHVWRLKTRYTRVIRPVEWVKTWLSQFVDMFICESLQTRDQLEEIQRFCNKTVYLPNGYCATSVRYEEDERLMKGKKNIVLYVGRMGSEQKNAELLLDAIERACLEDIQGWVFLFIGSMTSDFKEKFDSLKRRMKGKDIGIQYLGYIEDIEELEYWYRVSRVFCITSREEGFPNVLPTAMRNGACIVTTPQHYNAEIIKASKAGFEVDSTVDSYAKGLMKVMMNNALCEECGKRAREFAVNVLSWDSVLKDLLDSLETMNK